MKIIRKCDNKIFLMLRPIIFEEATFMTRQKFRARPKFGARPHFRPKVRPVQF